MAPNELPRTADVVIVGGGAVGCSIAYHLTQRGCRDVVLLERDQLGNGATGHCAGLLGPTKGVEPSFRMSIESVQFWRRFADTLEHPFDFYGVGRLWVALNEREAEQIRKFHLRLEAAGVSSRLLSPEEARELTPHLNIEDVVLGIHVPVAGHAGPHEAVQGFAAAAARGGARIYEGVPARGIRVEHGRVVGVQTDQGEVATRLVVNAAGPWSALIGRMVGVTVPVKPMRRHIYVTTPFPQISDTAPTLHEWGRGFYWRKEGPGILMTSCEQVEMPDFQVGEMDPAMLPVAVERALNRLPVLAEARIQNSWAGLREITPDEESIIGPVPGLEGFLCATGFSGHGFTQSPVTGRLVAELILDGRTTLDISALSIERFAPVPQT